LVVALAGGVGLYWLLSDRLTDEERQLVGVWSRKVTLKSPDDTLVVWELNDDRSIRIAGFDIATDQPLQPAIEGRWSVRSGELVIDYEARTLHRLSRSVSAFQSRFRPLNTESLTVESVERDTLRLRTRGRPPLHPPETHVYTRAADDIVMPASFTPNGLANNLGR
jgi:hypothetical protein